MNIDPQMLEVLLEEAVESTGLGRDFRNLCKAVERLKHQVQANQDFFDRTSWVFDGDDAPRKTIPQLRKNSMKPGDPGYVGGVHGPVVPMTQVNQGARVKVLNSTQLEDLRRKGLGMPPLALEKAIMGGVRQAIDQRRYSQYAEEAAEKLRGFRALPSNLAGLVSGTHWNGVGGVRRGPIAGKWRNSNRPSGANGWQVGERPAQGQRPPDEA